jgi:DNA mismatch repair protein MutS
MAPRPLPAGVGAAERQDLRPDALPTVPSVLDHDAGPPPTAHGQPNFFADLNLDQLVASVTAGRAEYDLPPFFHRPLGSADAVHYRQEVFRDLQVPEVRRAVDDFAGLMRETRRLQTRANRSHYHYHRERWWFDAGATYCRAVEGLTRSLAAADLRSCGVTAVCDALLRHVASDGFRSLVAQTAAVRERLGAVRYCLAIRGGSIRVTRFDDEADYSEAVERVFERFQQGESRPVKVEFTTSPDMNHIEAGVVGRPPRCPRARGSGPAGNRGGLAAELRRQQEREQPDVPDHRGGTPLGLPGGVGTG